jgi:hypothetical protein
MKKTIVVLAAMATTVSISLIACQSSKKEQQAKEITQDSLVKRGNYLVNAIGCDDCHSPKKFGPKGPEVIAELRFSGYPGERALQKADTNVVKGGWVMMNHDLTSAVGPWGASFAANITSDETGIGNWTEEQFVRAIREGKMKGLSEGRPMLPPMPWFTYRNLSDLDIQSIFAYLKTSKPVRNVVPGPVPMKDL